MPLAEVDGSSRRRSRLALSHSIQDGLVCRCCPSATVSRKCWVLYLAPAYPRSHDCQNDSRQGSKGMLPLRFFQQSHREAMQPREEKTRGLTTADLIRMCRAT